MFLPLPISLLIFVQIFDSLFVFKFILQSMYNKAVNDKGEFAFIEMIFAIQVFITIFKNK